MATGILSVLWRDELGVYDVRVCGQLGAFQTLCNKTDPEGIWEGYREYLAGVAGGGLRLKA